MVWYAGAGAKNIGIPKMPLIVVFPPPMITLPLIFTLVSDKPVEGFTVPVPTKLIVPAAGDWPWLPPGLTLLTVPVAAIFRNHEVPASNRPLVKFKMGVVVLFVVNVTVLLPTAPVLEMVRLPPATIVNGKPKPVTWLATELLYK